MTKTQILKRKIELKRQLITLIEDEIKVMGASLKEAPLTKEEITKLNDKFGYFEFGDAQGDKTIAFVREIEKKHGII